MSPLKAVAGAVGNRISLHIEITFSDRSSRRNRDKAPVLRLKFNTAKGEWRALLFGHVGLLEAYFDGDLDVDGELALAFRAGLESGVDKRRNPLLWLRNQWHELRCANRSLSQAKRNARFHYGLGKEFYELWLDRPLMMYTCGYWKGSTDSIEQAQRNKLDHICRKIRLQPGETVMDIGCGYGGFMFHALENYGAKVTGVNTTTEQVEWLHAEIVRRGLSHELSVREADFREIDAEYDKIVSIGVLEHAGRDQLVEVVKAHARALKAAGIGMLHFIGHVNHRDTEYYIREHVFPGGWIPSLSRTLAIMEDCGLEILDVENLRRHYALTLDAWSDRFDRHWPRIHALNPKRFNERVRRVWRTYLYSCAEMFRSPHANTCLFQILFSKGHLGRDTYPMSRAHLYEAELRSMHRHSSQQEVKPE